MQQVILASSSPRRKQLLGLVGIGHTVIPADIDELPLPGELPNGHAERLAREKAQAIAEAFPNELVIGADTIVVLDHRILGKPRDENHAREMLAELSGRTHTVVTAMACALKGEIVSGVETVEVTFRYLTAAEIEAYVATGEPMDKAGSYGIQGFGATIVKRIDGDYFAVMGLSLVRLVSLMRDLGVAYNFAR